MDSCDPCIDGTVSAAGSTECSPCQEGSQANTAKTECGEYFLNIPAIHNFEC